VRKHYDKLVRDKIPQIIEDDGKRALVSQITRGAFKEYALKKLREEVEEFIQEPSAEEAADIIEILETICNREAILPDEIKAQRIAKRVTKGAFQMGFLLEWVED